MDALRHGGVYGLDLEVRIERDELARPILPDSDDPDEWRELLGHFQYGERAIISDRGRVRKEEVAANAFGWAVSNEQREIHLLIGHSYDTPIASKHSGSLRLTSDDKRVSFVADLPAPSKRPQYLRDFLLNMAGGKLRFGVSPGFRVPPHSTVPSAEEVIPEPGNPLVGIRRIIAAVLFELSFVTRPAYPNTQVEARDDFGGLWIPDTRPKAATLWL